MHRSDFSVAMFPYLKTGGRVRLGRYQFRCTTDLEGLSEAQRAAVSELSEMLFLRDNLRIKRASYAIAPGLGALRPDPTILDLSRVRTVMAYLYSSPHPTTGDVFLPPDEVSLLVVAPANVPAPLVRGIEGTAVAGAPAADDPDRFGQIPGYEGVVNTDEPIWLERGSRVYGPKPQMTLNLSQDLQADIERTSPPHRLLLGLLTRPASPFSERIFTALEWYNRASQRWGHDDQSLLNLAVAFESLMDLPVSEKTDRLSDAISLLLGRTDRLKAWAKQFYDQRSAVAHSGRVNDWWFYAAGDGKTGSEHHPFGNLMTYGREIFQLCLKTLLVGADLAEAAGLKERFISNSERYQQIARDLSQDSGSPAERLLGVRRLVDEVVEFWFVPSKSLTADQILNAVRAASAALLETTCLGNEEMTDALTAMAASPRKGPDLPKLTPLERLAALFKSSWPNLDEEPEVHIVATLVQQAWSQLGMSYHRLQAQAKVEALNAGAAERTG